MPSVTVSDAGIILADGTGPEPERRPGPKATRNRALVEIYSGVRLRMADLCCLRLDGVRWDGPGPCLTWVDGRGRTCTAPMSQAVQQALRAWLADRPANAGEWLFNGPRPDMPLTRQAVWMALHGQARRSPGTKTGRPKAGRGRRQKAWPRKLASPVAARHAAPGAAPLPGQAPAPHRPSRSARASVSRQARLTQVQEWVARGVSVLLQCLLAEVRVNTEGVEEPGGP